MEILKIKAEIHSTENGKTIKSIRIANKQNACPLKRLIKLMKPSKTDEEEGERERRRRQIANIRN